MLVHTACRSGAPQLVRGMASCASAAGLASSIRHPAREPSQRIAIPVIRRSTEPGNGGGRNACEAEPALRRRTPQRGCFFTYSDFSFIAPKPSILQSMSWSSSTRRMFFTLVPCFTTPERAFELQVLDDGDRVAVLQHIAVGVLVDARAVGSGGARRPLVPTFGAHEHRAVLISEGGRAAGAGRQRV